jgi:hypothetical protein
MLLDDNLVAQHRAELVEGASTKLLQTVESNQVLDLPID